MPGGRPSILTPELQAAICKSIGSGLTFSDACRINDISESIFYLWKQLGDSKDPANMVYSEFLEAVKKAEAQFKLTHLQRIDEASKTTHQASEWLLERKYPQEFASRQQIAVTDKLDQFIKAFDEVK